MIDWKPIVNPKDVTDDRYWLLTNGNVVWIGHYSDSEGWMTDHIDPETGLVEKALYTPTMFAYVNMPWVKPRDVEEVAETSQGYGLFRRVNEVGGHTYFSDEVGGGVFVWDTALVSAETLKHCLKLEEEANGSND